MKARPARFINLAIVVATATVILLLVLIEAGYLILPQSTPDPITITETHVTIVEGTNASGGFWFGPDNLSYPGVNGYPTTVPSGGTFAYVWGLWNRDNASHWVYSFTIAPPFTLVSVHPAVPIIVKAGTDDAIFTVTILDPSDPGAFLPLSVTINTLNPP